MGYIANEYGTNWIEKLYDWKIIIFNTEEIIDQK